MIRFAEVAVFCAVLFLFSAAPVQAFQQRAPKLVVLEGPPLSVEMLTRLITAKFRTKFLVPREDVGKAILNRGVSFEPDDAVLQQLKQAGATDEIIAAILKIKPPKPPAPKLVAAPKPVLGLLNVRCAPAECSILIDARPIEQTRSGAFQKELPFGRYAVTANREGYLTDQKTIVLAEGGASITFALQPTQATKVQMARELLKRMFQAAGESGSVEALAKGSWTTSTGGVPVERTFWMRLGASQTALSLNSPSGGLQIICSRESCQTKRDAIKEQRAKKELTGEEATRVDAWLKLFRRYYTPHVLRDLREGVDAARLRPLTETDAIGPDGYYNLSLESNDEIYRLKLDLQFLPAELSYASKLAANSGIVATYSDYVDVGGRKYPKRIQIKLSDKQQELIQIRFATIESQ